MEVQEIQVHLHQHQTKVLRVILVDLVHYLVLLLVVAVVVDVGMTVVVLLD